MKIKCFVLVVLFCAISSSALAWSWPWARKVELTPRLPIPIPMCKETPALVASVVPDAYCCGEADKTKRLECLERNGAQIQRITDFLSIKISCMFSMSACSGGVPPEAAFPPGTPIDEIIAGKIRVIDEKIRWFDSIYNEVLGKIGLCSPSGGASTPPSEPPSSEPVPTEPPSEEPH